MQLIEDEKKAKMASEAERLLADTGWLPEPLRLVTGDGQDVAPSDEGAEEAALPDFLAGDIEGTADGGEAGVLDHHEVAAE